MDKEMLLSYFKNSGATVAEIYKGGGGEQCILPKSFVINMVDQLDEPKKAVIPQFVADEFDYEKSAWYRGDETKDIPLTLRYAFENPGSDDFLDWVRENPEDYVTAVRNGYEIEKEPLYIISMPKTDDVLACWENEVNFEFTSEASIIGNSDWKYTFTESEIKSIDERFWPFAELVEETP